MVSKRIGCFHQCFERHERAFLVTSCLFFLLLLIWSLIHNSIFSPLPYCYPLEVTSAANIQEKCTNISTGADIAVGVIAGLMVIIALAFVIIVLVVPSDWSFHAQQNVTYGFVVLIGLISITLQIIPAIVNRSSVIFVNDLAPLDFSYSVTPYNDNSYAIITITADAQLYREASISKVALRLIEQDASTGSLSRKKIVGGMFSMLNDRIPNGISLDPSNSIIDLNSDDYKNQNIIELKWNATGLKNNQKYAFVLEPEKLRDYVSKLDHSLIIKRLIKAKSQAVTGNDDDKDGVRHVLRYVDFRVPFMCTYSDSRGC